MYGMKLDGERVRDLAKQAGWTLQQLIVEARKYRRGLSQTTVYNAVNGKIEPTADVVNALALSLGVNPAYLWGLTDDPSIIASLDLDPDTLDVVRRIGRLSDEQRRSVVDVVDRVLDLVERVDQAVALPPVRIAQEASAERAATPAEEQPEAAPQVPAEIAALEARLRAEIETLSLVDRPFAENVLSMSLEELQRYFPWIVDLVRLSFEAKAGSSSGRTGLSEAHGGKSMPSRP
jgi:transcriptional regulator with XRE-family HTH domain